MTRYDLAPWHDFCLALAGASGALLGLAFVAISFNLDAIIADKLLPGRRTARARAEGRPPPLATRARRAAHLATEPRRPGSLLATLAVIAALATITISIGGLYWLGGAMALATSAGLINSWVLLVEITR